MDLQAVHQRQWNTAPTFLQDNQQWTPKLRCYHRGDQFWFSNGNAHFTFHGNSPRGALQLRHIWRHHYRGHTCCRPQCQSKREQTTLFLFEAPSCRQHDCISVNTTIQDTRVDQNNNNTDASKGGVTPLFIIFPSMHKRTETYTRRSRYDHVIFWLSVDRQTATDIICPTQAAQTLRHASS